MPIPDSEINRAVAPRILAPSSTFAELLGLFAVQEVPEHCFVVVRVGAQAYDVLALNDDDLKRLAAERGTALLPLTLAAVPGFLKPAAPVVQSQIGGTYAIRIKNYRTPRRRLVVLDDSGAVVGVMTTTFMAGDRDLASPANLLSAESVSLPPHLNTRFKGAGVSPSGVLTVNTPVDLLVWVGAPIESEGPQSSRLFTFDFRGVTEPVRFTVRLDADPEVWSIAPEQDELIVEPPGRSARMAQFQVTALRPASEKLHLAVQRDGVTIQHVWLPVVAAEAGMPVAPLIAEQTVAGLPFDAPPPKPATVELVVQPGPEDSRVIVDANLPGGRIHQTYTIPVGREELQNAALRLRAELEKIVRFTDAAGRMVFARALPVDEALARRQYVALADAGEQIWRMLFRRKRASEELHRLAEEVRNLPVGSRFQVVIEDRSFIIPWALLYDRPGDITVDTLDWSGFWGYRFIITVLPPGRYPSPEITDPPADTLLLLNDDPDLMQYTSAQAAAAQSLFRASAHSGQAAITALLRAPESDLLYCYCHGKCASGAREPGRLATESAIFFSGNERLRIADLERREAAPLAGRPLVFLNACEGATQEPFYYDGFMPFFIEQQQARGFIGTEVVAPALLAHDLALRFMQRFAAGDEVGAILLAARRHYLDAYNNILAFNYSLYGHADIRLAVASAPASNVRSEPASASGPENPGHPASQGEPAPQRALPAGDPQGPAAGLTVWALPEIRRRVAALRVEVDERRKAAENNLAGAGVNRSQLRALDVMMDELLERQDRLLQQAEAAASATERASRYAELQREIVGAHGLWRLFRFIFDQRHDEPGRTLLRAADVIAADCYNSMMATAVRWQLLRDEVRPPPLTFFDAEFSALTASRGAEARAFGLALGRYRRLRLPLPVILLPSDQAESLWLYTTLHHEVGHNLDQDLRPPGGRLISEELSRHATSVLDAIRERDWERWMPEIVADAFGVLLGGAGFGYTMAALLLAAPVAERPDPGEHPNTPLRLRLLAELLRRCALPQFDAVAGWIDQALAAVPVPTALHPYLDDVAAVAAMTLDMPLMALGQRPLCQLAPDLAGEATLIEQLACHLLDPQAQPPNAHGYPWRLVPAAAQYAVARLTAPDTEALNEIHTRALAFLNSAVPQSLLLGDDAAGPLSAGRKDFWKRLAAALEF
ncbi:MAG: hypothetical protein NZ701_03230, partial [Roseiflexus sp.]|nr:hypothetical protein [Roseiflexus sp.]